LDKHIPLYYIGGVYIEQNGVWCGDFIATAGELVEYAHNDTETIEQYDTVLCMILAQQEYMLWWEKMRGRIR
jgi:hypothetical protein